MSVPFRKVLIANRGEIACRVERTCRRLGVRTVAVYSEADADALHVRGADEAVRLGPSPAKESYLRIDRILHAARQTGAEAIHPGYGFLSENEDFAEACAQAGLVFIGPPASAIRAMGSKSAAKALLQTAGVPLTPGYHGPQQDVAFLQWQADAIGYPLLIKASAGGGGKGMRRVDGPAEFAGALAACKREAASSFGDDHVLLERYVLQPRHIEVQIFADVQGKVVSLFERDCSVQRRHQKVLEEAPAPGITTERRAAMSRAATNAARSVGYVNAGTVEFIVDPAGNFYFMEMNTRLQVEHPVTELITGLDLVEWQLRIAAGEPLPLQQAQLEAQGHAIEARVYAEDPAQGFLPSTGRLRHLRQPPASDHVRVDSGVTQDDEITAFYDPMIAKLISWDETREGALEHLQRALATFEVVGVKTNLAFLQRVVSSPSFTEARLDTALIERESDFLHAGKDAEVGQGGTAACLLAALALLLSEQIKEKGTSPWDRLEGWRLNSRYRRHLRFAGLGTVYEVEAEYASDGFMLSLQGQSVLARGHSEGDGSLVAELNGVRQRATAILAGDTWHIFHAGGSAELRYLDPLARDGSGEAQDSSLLSPMPGRITAVLVKPGERVAKGDPLVVLEAMKMEYTLQAPAAGRVETLLFEVGEQVPEATQLLTFLPDEDVPEGRKEQQ